MSPVLEGVQTERVDDLALLLSFMQKQGWPELFNSHLPHHPNQLGVDLGWVMVVWLAYILSQGDHRKVAVQGWVEERLESLQRLTGIEMSGNDFNDDRLSILLRYLSQGDLWQGLEREVSGRSIEVYDLARAVVRHDATTANGYHLVSEAGLFQFGHSKDDSHRPQVKIMMSSLDPLGLPLVTRTVSGERADDGLYLPTIIQTQQTVGRSGLLHVGDSKMSAFGIRAHLVQTGDYYLCPLPMTGKTPQALRGWIQQAKSDPLGLQLVERPDAAGEIEVIGEAYEVHRPLVTIGAEPAIAWTERVFVVYSPAYAQQQINGFETRLTQTIAKLWALTENPKRGKPIYRDLESLQSKVAAVLKPARLEDFLQIEYEPQSNGSQDTRYVIRTIQRQQQAIQAEIDQLGWRPYVSNAPPQQLSLSDAVLTYRHEWRIEQGFRHLKGAQLSITPLFVQNDDQVIGLLNLLSIALHLITLMQFVVRRHLNATGSTLSGLYPDNPRKQTATPTFERLLKAFGNWTVTIIQINGQRLIHAPPLSSTQMQILKALGLPRDTYSRLATTLENSS
jgi:transposase